MANEIMDVTFYEQIKKILSSARAKVYSTANFAMVEAYWEICKSIVDKQCGNQAADYGAKLIEELSKKMTADYGKGFTVTNLKYMRQFYLAFPIRHALRDQLSWTHYRMLLKVEDEKVRKFYMDECIRANWSTRQLERQMNTFSYHRLLASHGNYDVVEDTTKKETARTPEDIIRDLYVLEFLGLEQNSSFYESDLEQALMDHLQKFLLELGRGFCFVGRQHRISFDTQHFYIDLVFYNYILKCFVLIDLKTSKLTHQDIGQMQIYVNYYTCEMMNEGDNPLSVFCYVQIEMIRLYIILYQRKTRKFSLRNIEHTCLAKKSCKKKLLLNIRRLLINKIRQCKNQSELALHCLIRNENHCSVHLIF
ncbi:MAG: PDDEXK nuclease domain-containing protein [Staphylococcus sp.]|nr:PDDEXK nuclease domain-containing protein [Anaeroplasma bactoclasticum]MCM1261046.1 PDDEXK nuclease domain-containing protein [Staphylococcus sp.]MCM1556371.1 PDDEXK nuclease domain-containing protein [Anaeroplasma bactoclasticum]